MNTGNYICLKSCLWIKYRILISSSLRQWSCRLCGVYPCPRGGGSFAVSLCCLLAWVVDPSFHTWAARRNKHGQFHFLMEFWGNDASLVLLYKPTVFLWDKWTCSTLFVFPSLVLQYCKHHKPKDSIPVFLGPWGWSGGILEGWVLCTLRAQL